MCPVSRALHGTKMAISRKIGAFKPVKALRGGGRPSKDVGSQLWDQDELSRDFGGQGPSWWALAANLRWRYV